MLPLVRSARYGVWMAASRALLFYRLPSRGSQRELDSLISREGSFLLNILLLVAVAFAVLWGTVSPILTELVRGVKMTIGPLSSAGSPAPSL